MCFFGRRNYGNNHAKLFLIVTSGSGNVDLSFFLFLALVAILFGQVEPFVLFW